MPRNYVSAGKKNCQYSKQDLEIALKAYLDGKLSMKQACEKYHIPKGTLFNRVHGLKGKSYGGPTVFSTGEENIMVNCLLICASWGFPLNTLDVRLFAKGYLDRVGRTEKKFVNNMPGVEWAKSFLQRHSDKLSERFANNIKTARASVNEDIIKEYHTNLSGTIEGLPAENIFNYDESNLSDDPGKNKMIFKRGVKYPDNIMNHTKSSVSFMMCVSADGTALPPYVVYKSAHLYDTWREGGPKGEPFCIKPCCSRGTRFNRTSHGWFDTITFTDWFKSIFLPHASRLPGKKVLIGDNLSSHFNEEVLELCEKNEIFFVCLPANATHLCQPLDVSFFGPLKKSWRKILNTWKKAHSKSSAVEKSLFPKMLKQLFIELQNMHQNVSSGFEATGIHPLNVEKLLQRIPRKETLTPSKHPDTPKAITETLVEFLSQQRHPVQSSSDCNKAKKSKKRLFLAPGQSVASEDSPLKDDSATSLPVTRETGSARKLSFVSPGKSLTLNAERPTKIARKETAPQNSMTVPKEGDFVLVNFKQSKSDLYYVGQVKGKLNKSGDLEVKFMRRSNKIPGAFHFPNVEDVAYVKIDQIVKVINEVSDSKRLTSRQKSYFNFVLDIENVR